MSDQPSNLTGVSNLLAKFEQTSDGWLLHDSVSRRRRLAELMAEHNDPLVREMGKQLRDGQATPQQLLSVPQYWEALQQGVANLAETNLDEVESQVDDVLERERDERERDEREREERER